MVSEAPSTKIDVDATIEMHGVAIRTEGYQYLLKAERQNLPAITRQRILIASLKYLKNRSKSHAGAGRSSQTNTLSQSTIPQPNLRARANSERDSSFQVYVAALIDESIAVKCLIDLCVRATDGAFLPILVKILFVLSKIGSISNENLGEGTQRLLENSQSDDEGIQIVKSNIKDVNETFQGSQHFLHTQDNENDGSQKQLKLRRTGQSFVDDFVTNLVKNFCEKRKKDDEIDPIFVSSLAKEAPLSPHTTSLVLSLLTEGLRNINVVELPGYIYQLMLLASSKGNSNEKSHILLSLSEIFEDHEERAHKYDEVSQSILAEDEDAIIASGVTIKYLREIQGTALVHTDYAVKQDPSLSQEIVKLVKGGVELPRHFLTTFGIGITLSIARSASLQIDVLQLLREAIKKFEKEGRLREQNLYVTRVTLNDKEVTNPRSSLIQIAESASETGWDHVRDSLLHFSFLLLDQPLQVSSQSTLENDSLALNLIVKLFASQPIMQETILDRLINRIALREKCAPTAIEIIGKLSTRMPFDLIKYSTLIKGGIEFLVSSPPWIADALMSAYSPVLAAKKDLLDFFHLVVRKSLFRRDSCARATAITGFLRAAVMTAKSKGGDSFARTLGSQRSYGSQDNIPDRMIETLQPLRRIFSCDAPLRAYFYQRVLAVVRNATDKNIRKNTALACEDIIRGHFQRYVEMSRAPYLIIDPAVNETAGGKLIEPVGDLIWCLATLEYYKGPKIYVNSYIVELAKKIASVSLRDFSVTKEFLLAIDDDGSNDPDETIKTAGNGAARSARNKVRLLGSVIEALINSMLLIPIPQQNWDNIRQIIAPLLFLRVEVFELLKNAGIASFVDAFQDFGGDTTIERMRPGIRLQCMRGPKLSNSTKRKADGSKKSKSGESGTSSSNSQNGSNSLYSRLGVFSVLASAASKPMLPLSICTGMLQMMNDLRNGENKRTNIFEGNEDSREFQELYNYMMATTQKHVEDFVYRRTSVQDDEILKDASETKEVTRACQLLAALAIRDYKLQQNSSSDSRGLGATRSLQVVDSCFRALPVIALTKTNVISKFCEAFLKSLDVSTEGGDEEKCEGALESLQRLVESLLEDQRMKDITIILHIHGILLKAVAPIHSSVEKKSKFLAHQCTWASQVLITTSIGDANVVKALIHICTTYTENNNDLRQSVEISQRLLHVLGDCESRAIPDSCEDEDTKLSAAKGINQSTSLVAVDALLDVVERALTDVEWCLSRMKSLETAVEEFHQSSNENDIERDVDKRVDSRVQEETAKRAIRAEDAAQVRLEGIVRLLRGLVQCAISKWSQQERLLRLTSRTYKMLSLATTSQSKRKGDPRTSFVSLINEVKSLGPVLWTYLTYVGEGSGYEQSKKGPSKATREARVMPHLIYEVEKFEKVLIAAQKRTKISLLRGMRRNVARDFRIREDRLREEADNSRDDENQEDEDGNIQNEERDNSKNSRVKKRRIS